MTPRSSKLPMLALFVGIIILVAAISVQAAQAAQAGDVCSPVGASLLEFL